MPLYSFKLINTRLVSDFGVHELPGEAEAQIEAIGLLGRCAKLARS